MVWKIKPTNLRTNQPKNVSLLQCTAIEIAQHRAGCMYRYTIVGCRKQTYHRTTIET
ncbi:hypothetical protein [Dysgonomonas sp. BGC7]|uniref:hypothetical protein n=1 Tax=Dysgonomonas sp. BGC7 TaxID=1658008 RepID=UPI0012FB5AF6|nr:hypothetical protein [Dysgonomonas sp. BGC7]MBD8388899.1 hypothetical protein [Dysgonomonas sp. BGC7]